MNKIEVKVLNPEAVPQAEKMMVCAARLTQSGHKIKSLADFMALYEKPYNEKTVQRMTNLPHPTIQKFAAINVVVVGASRRFLAQVTRHQNEVKFMSASLQYSDYSGEAAFAVPYEVMAHGEEETFLATCEQAMENYTASVKHGLGNDAAGYMAPQALRNVLIISATPYQWRHMIGQRTCRRNTSETRIVFLKIWKELYQLNPVFFARTTTGPFCMRDICQEGRMRCGNVMPIQEPAELLALDYPLLSDPMPAEVEKATAPEFVAVDFDGTLCVDAFPEIGAPRPKVIAYVKALAARGSKIILYTCRENGYQPLLDNAIAFCEAQGIPLYAVNENPGNTWPAKLGQNPDKLRKVYASLYIDDKGLTPDEIEAMPFSVVGE